MRSAISHLAPMTRSTERARRARARKPWMHKRWWCSTKPSFCGEKFVYIDAPCPTPRRHPSSSESPTSRMWCEPSPVRFGLPPRLRDGHGPGTFAVPIRWGAAIGEACGWRGIARTKGHGEIHMAHRAAGKGHREQQEQEPFRHCSLTRASKPAKEILPPTPKTRGFCIVTPAKADIQVTGWSGQAGQ